MRRRMHHGHHHGGHWDDGWGNGPVHHHGSGMGHGARMGAGATLAITLVVSAILIGVSGLLFFFARQEDEFFARLTSSAEGEVVRAQRFERLEDHGWWDDWTGWWIEHWVLVVWWEFDARFQPENSDIPLFYGWENDWSTHRVGDRITIFYNPDNHNEASRFDSVGFSGLRLGGWITGGIGALVLIGGVIAFVKMKTNEDAIR